MRFTAVLITFALLFLSLAAVPVSAQVTAGSGTLVAEATLFENEPGSNGGSYPEVCVGNLSSGVSTRRGLMRFELPDIPAGATITAVSLEMQQDRVRNQGSGPKAVTVELRRVVDAWEEGSGGGQRRACGGGSAGAGVTWSNQPATLSEPSASLSLPVTESFDFSFDSAAGSEGLIADLQAWVDGESNNGWMISITTESDADTARLLEIGALSIEWDTATEEPAFNVNAGLNDAWFNPATSGQGFFFTVYPGLERLFLSWFTYDTERPDEMTSALLGEPGHRWITAIGPYDGKDAVLDATLTRGGVFDSSTPEVVNETGYGTIFIEFQGCDSATVSYVFPSLNLSGDVQLERVVKDNVALCEALLESAPAR